MLQNQTALKIATFANFKTNHEISFTWGNDFTFDLLDKARNLKIGHLSNFGDFQTGQPTLAATLKLDFCYRHVYN